MRKLCTVAFCSLLLGLASMPTMADDWDKKTTITFTQPVEIPGMVLPAGTYVFKLANSESDRNIVLIYNAQETHLYKIVLAINNYRLVPKDKSVITFEERTKDALEAVHAWFYPGSSWGQEFVYPKAQAKAIAEAANVPVLSAETGTTEEAETLLNEPVLTVTPETAAVEEAALTPGEETKVAAEIEEVTPESVEGLVPEVAAVPEETLPSTAGNLPLVALLGVSSLALGGLLKLLAAR
jgi:hypothetical protein